MGSTSQGKAHGSLALCLALLAGHFASFAPSRTPLFTDIRYFVYYAGRVAAGEVPHRDLFAVKTQLATVVGAGFHALGDGLGLDPLLAIRIGFLALACLTAVLGVVVFRELARDRLETGRAGLSGGALGGALGALASCSFGLLGALAFVGRTRRRRG